MAKVCPGGESQLALPTVRPHQNAHTYILLAEELAEDLAEREAHLRARCVAVGERYSRGLRRMTSARAAQGV